MLKEKWSKGKEAGCVVSDTPNRHNRDDDHVGYYGGYLIAESIPKQEYVNVIARSLSMLALLEKALPIIEEEAERRETAPGGHFIGGYYTEMRQLANTIQAEIAKAKGDTVIDAELCPHGFGFVEYCPDCKEAEGKGVSDG